MSQRRLVREDLTYPRLENELRLTMAPLQGNQMHGFLVTRSLQVGRGTGLYAGHRARSFSAQILTLR